MTTVISLAEVPGSKELMLKSLRRCIKHVKAIDEPNNGLYVVLLNDRDQPMLLETANLHPMQIVGSCTVVGLQQAMELLPLDDDEDEEDG